MAWVWLAGAISLEVVATLNLKVSEGFTRFWPSVIVILGYVGSFSLLGATLKRIDVGTVYAIWSGAGTVVVVFVGILIFGESAAAVRLLGIGVITVGVIVVNLGGGGHGSEGAEAVEASGVNPPDIPPSPSPAVKLIPIQRVSAEFTPVPRQAPKQVPKQVLRPVPKSAPTVPIPVTRSPAEASNVAANEAPGVVPAASDSAERPASRHAARRRSGERQEPPFVAVPKPRAASDPGRRSGGKHVDHSRSGFLNRARP